MIEPGRVLLDVREQLRDVLPEVGSVHGRAVLGAALGILDEVAGRVVLDASPAAATVEEALPALERWEQALAGQAPAAAGALAAERRQAEAETSPERAREAVLAAAELTVVSAWRELEAGEREAVLAEVRRVLRADAERCGGGDD